MPLELTDWTDGQIDARRDRIVILGRRRAGKTVFLSRLYQKLWQGNEGVSARAGDGAMHERCMEICEGLSQGKWPAATAGSILSQLEITHDEHCIQVVILDYPGEVFRRAFVDGGRDEQSLTLLEHIDRAAGAIMLIDPDNLEGGSTAEQVDDDYGMVQAVDRIRKSPGGASVPVAVVLTKCDEHVQLIREAGTPRDFMESRIPNLFRYGGKLRVFGSSAVRIRRDAIGRGIPNTEKPARGLIEPLRYCLRAIKLASDVPTSPHQPPTPKVIAPAYNIPSRVTPARRGIPTWAIVCGAVALVFLIVVIVLVLAD